MRGNQATCVCCKERCIWQNADLFALAVCHCVPLDRFAWMTKPNICVTSAQRSWFVFPRPDTLLFACPSMRAANSAGARKPSLFH